MNLNCRSCHTSVPRKRRDNHKNNTQLSKYLVVLGVGFYFVNCFDSNTQRFLQTWTKTLCYQMLTVKHAAHSKEIVFSFSRVENPRYLPTMAGTPSVAHATMFVKEINCFASSQTKSEILFDLLCSFLNTCKIKAFP